MENKNKHSLPDIQKDLEMRKYLNLDNERIKKMLEIKLQVFNKEISPLEARNIVNDTFESVTPEEFAYGEQHLYNAGITDEIMAEGMNDILDVFKDVLESNPLNLPKGHPIRTYSDESIALESLLQEIELQQKKKFIKNEWLDLYERLSKINVHFSRKQHQLFPALERKGFDRPSKIMWTFDDNVRDAIKDAFNLLKDDKDQEFLDEQDNVIFLVRDILEKERDILYPTSLKLINDEEFAKMRISDDEIGYCLIPNPPQFKHVDTNNKTTTKDNEDSLLEDLNTVLAKHGLLSKNSSEVLDVSNGKLTLEQINLIYKHIQVDLSYVDENEIVKFYTDTKHRVFPRSAGVIGRKVQNCHPRESVSNVEAIIDAFRKGEQDKAEFWLDRGDQFIYIIFNAVRDDQGNFRGVLEMMQDVTHIRSLQGSQRLLSWKNEKVDTQESDKISQVEIKNNKQLVLSPKTLIGNVINEYPFVRDYLVSLSPNYNRLTNPVVFKTMKNVATLDMISKVGGYEVDELINMLNTEIKNKV